MSTVQTAYSQPQQNASGAINLSAPDLTRHPPRSPRSKLGGFVHLPRLIDKARASLAGRLGDFHYNCPMDQHFLRFTGLAPEPLLAAIKTAKGDGDVLAYVAANSNPKRQPWEIAAWSAWYEKLTPSATEAREFFNDIHKKNGPHREDIVTWFDWLELDDFVTYGGRA